jgi:hypothetical protein
LPLRTHSCLAFVRAASRLFSTRLRFSDAGRRHECRRGTQECVRHTRSYMPPRPACGSGKSLRGSFSARVAAL